MEEVNITIVGAGVVGLAVGYEISKNYKDIFILEKNISFGQETSSRNSEVIHAGIYYPKDYLKTKTCIEGRELLYEFCLKNKINHKRIGKLIVATDKNEEKILEALFKNGLDNGLEELRLLKKSEIKKLEPYVEAESAIYSPYTGILDTHHFMQKLLEKFKSHGGQISYLTELIGIDKVENGFLLTVRDKIETFKFFSRIVINCAGLNADKVARIAGIEDPDYRIVYCKGSYFRLNPSKAKFIKHLIYPVPRKESKTLGIHATLDLAGSLRLGPDEDYIDEINYSVDESKKGIFFESVKKFLPFIELEDLYPDTSGIRPKLKNKDDFIVREESNRGIEGLINLLGIESPGFTSCLSLAKIVREIVEKLGK